ncbi:hypothetical protein HOA93_03225 [bacterium]|nr:hypothetical protein [bacterium]
MRVVAKYFLLNQTASDINQFLSSITAFDNNFHHHVFDVLSESNVTNIVFFSFTFIREKLSKTFVLSSYSLGYCFNKSHTQITPPFSRAFI